MAIKPTIFKLTIALSDIERGYYDSLNLTVAQHPSETRERMMVRVLAYCLNARDGLSFGKGLSAVDEPDLWARGLDGQIELWIDVGEPAAERIKKASHLAGKVRVYSFNSKSAHWWGQDLDRFLALRAEFYQFPWAEIQALAKLVQRTMNLSVTITGDAAYVAADAGECEVHWQRLRAD